MSEFLRPGARAQAAGRTGPRSIGARPSLGTLLRVLRSGRSVPRWLRSVVAATLFVLAGLVGPGVASAATALTALSATNGEAIVDKTSTFAVSGTRDPEDTSFGFYLELQFNQASLGCAPNREANKERASGSTSETRISDYAFTDVSFNWSPTAAGAYVVCAYFFDLSGKTWATRQLPLTVREPQVSLQLRLPSQRIGANKVVPLDVTAFAEVERRVSVDVNPVGIACGQGVRSNQGQRVFEDRAVLGGPATFTVNFTTPAKGQWHLCGWIGRSADEPAPLLSVTGSEFWTGPAPKCRFGSAPKKPSGRVRVTCTSVSGSIEVRAKRGKKTFTTSVALVGGVGYARGRSVGLKRGSRVTVSAWQAGQKLGSRLLKVRRR